MITETEIENTKLSLKTVIIIIGWLASMAAVYYTMKFQINDLSERLNRIESDYGKYNLGTIQYQMSEMDKKITLINSNINELTKALMQPTTHR